MTSKYIHGYDHSENIRLRDQADTLAGLLHADTAYPSGCRVLEAGCGVGAQTVMLAGGSPGARITSLDISEASLRQARETVRAAGAPHIAFACADIFNMPFGPERFDHIFVCFVLEHMERPVEALSALGANLKKGGTITVIEGDHGTACFHPDSAAARRVIACQVELQKRERGDAMIGRQLYPLLQRAGYSRVRVSPRMVYVDGSRPDLIEGFTRKTFTAMIAGVRETAIEAGLIDPAAFDQGIADLYRTARPDGVFSYTFYKAVAFK